MFLKNEKVDAAAIAIENESGGVISYGQLSGRAKALAEMVPSRSIVFIFCDNTIETLEFYYKIMQIQAVPLLLDKSLDLEFYQNLKKIYQPQFVWGLKKRLQADTNLELMSEAQEHGLFKTEHRPYGIHEELGLLLMTSGSSGNPKLVRISYNNLLDNTKKFVDAVQLTREDAGITTLPMNYCYGLSLLHGHWRQGAKILVSDRTALDTRFWNFLESGKATNFAGVPYFYQILENIDFFEKKHESLRFVTEAGGKILKEKQVKYSRRFRNLGIDYYIFYGQTEGTTFLSYLPVSDSLSRLGSIGRGIGDLKPSIDSPNSEGVGELVFEGDSVSLGYAEKKEDLARGDHNHKKLLTGDMAKLDKDGFIYLMGRKSRYIKLLGIRMNLDDIEKIAKGYFADIDCACTGADDSILFYYKGEEHELEIKEYLKRKLHINSKLIDVVKTGKIPRNESGKVMYSELKAR